MTAKIKLGCIVQLEGDARLYRVTAIKGLRVAIELLGFPQFEDSGWIHKNNISVVNMA